MYPSLAKDILHIKNIPEGAQLLIYSIKGEMVAHQQIKENEAIDISNLPNGQYFAHIETVKDKLQTQFLVQK